MEYLMSNIKHIGRYFCTFQEKIPTGEILLSEIFQ